MSAVSTTERAFVDTNVLVYMVDTDAQAKMGKARELVLDLCGRGQLVLSTQVLQELYWVMTRKLRFPWPERGTGMVVEQLAPFTTVVPRVSMVLAAVRRSANGGPPLWGALILEAAEAAGASVLYTEDRSPLAAETPVRVVDPFLTA